MPLELLPSRLECSRLEKVSSESRFDTFYAPFSHRRNVIGKIGCGVGLYESEHDPGVVDGSWTHCDGGLLAEVVENTVKHTCCLQDWIWNTESRYVCACKQHCTILYNIYNIYYTKLTYTNIYSYIIAETSQFSFYFWLRQLFCCLSVMCCGC